tara:strand:- start:1381 stop:1620 length:240 start_codon:yes stop_codon:yes gene_type:complete
MYTIEEEEDAQKHEEFCDQVGQLVDIEETRGLDRIESGRALVAVGIAILHKEKGTQKSTVSEMNNLLDSWVEFNKSDSS